MDVDPILRSDAGDEMSESLRKINELLFLIAGSMAAAPGPPPTKED